MKSQLAEVPQDTRILDGLLTIEDLAVAGCALNQADKFPT